MIRTRQVSAFAFLVIGTGPLAAGVVTSVPDNGSGSLRQAIASEAAGGVITFVPGEDSA